MTLTQTKTSTWLEGYPTPEYCECCGHELMIPLHGLCKCCAAHHAALLDALRRALPLLEGDIEDEQRNGRMTELERSLAGIKLAYDIRRLLGEGDA